MRCLKSILVSKDSQVIVADEFGGFFTNRAIKSMSEIHLSHLLPPNGKYT